MKVEASSPAEELARARAREARLFHLTCIGYRETEVRLKRKGEKRG